MTHCQADHRFAAFRQKLVVLDQAAVLAQPRKRALDDPTMRLNGKALEVFVLPGLFDDLQSPAATRSGPVHEFAAVSRVYPD